MKKIRSQLFRNLILGLVLAVTVFILVFAWFSAIQEATASGLSVRSKGDVGLDSSFDDINYSTEIKRDLTSNFKFPLITGNGTSFFIPSIDRSSGTPLTNADGTWMKKRDVVAASYGEIGDYYVEDIYFKSDREMEVFLTDESSLTPLDDEKSDGTYDRKSDFGDFSKDNIAGAARVGFFEVNDDGEETPIFTWIPNEKYHLMVSDGMTPIPLTTTTTGSGSFDPTNPDNTFGLTDTTKYTPVSDKYFNEILYNKNQSSQVYSSQSRQMYKVVGTTDTYVAAVTVQSSTAVDHGVVITSKAQTSTYPTGYSPASFGANAGKSATQLEIKVSGYGAITAFFDGSTNIGDNSVPKLSVTSQLSADNFFGENDRFQLLIEYSPSQSLSNGQNFKITGFVFYNNTKNSGVNPNEWAGINGEAGAGIGTGAGVTVQYYSIDSGSTVAITNNTSTLTELTYALNASDQSIGTQKILMKSDGSDGIVPQNPLPTQLFTVITNGDYYQFKSVSTNKYLAISGGSIVLQDSAADFTLEKGTSGPRLKSDGYYITFADDSFSASTSSSNADLQIYQGTSYSFTKNGTAEGSYVYYNGTAETALTNYKLSSQLSDTPVVKLAETSSNSGEYKAHIRIKIWVEGTDREAKSPLAGGIFSTQLRFQGKLIEQATE